MTREEIERDIKVGSMVLGVITDLPRPMLIYEIEKEVTKRALTKYISELEIELESEEV